MAKKKHRRSTRYEKVPTNTQSVVVTDADIKVDAKKVKTFKKKRKKPWAHTSIGGKKGSINPVSGLPTLLKESDFNNIKNTIADALEYGTK